MANITVTVTEPSISANIETSTVTVTEATTNVILSETSVVSNTAVRAALSNVAPILYDQANGVFSIDESAVFAGKTTDDLTEGNTNLYLNGSGTTDDLAEGNINLYYTSSRFDAALATKTTDDLTEGNINLYYTSSRFDDALASKTTDIVNDFWIQSLREMKGFPITDELIDGLAKISKGTLETEIKKAVK